MAREWLVALRGDKTQEQIAKMAGIERSTYTKIETGSNSPGIPVAKRIAAVMGFPWTRFYDEMDDDTA